MKKIYVGNLSWNSTEADIREFFEQFGTVHSVAIITDRDTGRSRGFGFVEMDDANAQTAIEKLNGRSLGGRSLTVNEANERRNDRGGDRGPRGGGGGGGGRGRY